MSDDHISTTCPACAARLRITNRVAGKRVRCPKCSNAFTVEAPAAVEAAPIVEPSGIDDVLSGLADGTAVESPEAQHARLEAMAVQAARAAKGAAPAKAEEETTTASSFDWKSWLPDVGRALIPIGWAGRVCFAALIFGGVLVWLGSKELELRSRSREEPQIVTCEKLVAQGPGDNVHIVLTDFVLLPDYVYSQKTDRWSGAWVPAVPHQAVGAALAQALNVGVAELPSIDDDRKDKALAQLRSSDFNFKIVVAFPKADGKRYMERIFDAETVEGLLMVDGYLTTLDKESRGLLETSYPRADLKHCWVLVEGRSPASLAKARGYQFGGVGLVLFALVAAGWRAARQSV
jgi:predicted Zn finger-like uncharacterized protein